MGDISEMRGLVVAITFLGVMVLLIAWIPSQFYTASEGRTVTAPEMFEFIDIWSYAETFTCGMNETGGGTIGTMYYITNDGLDIGNRDFTFYYRQANETPLELKMQHNWMWFIFPQLEVMEWKNFQGVSRGLYLSVDEMEADSPDNSTVQYRVISPKKNFQYFASFSYNATLYGNFTHAWNFHELYFFWAVNFDQVGTSYNVAQLISMLLFFQFPDVNLYVNALMAIAFWTCIAYLVYVLIIKIIPLIAGG